MEHTGEEGLGRARVASPKGGLRVAALGESGKEYIGVFVVHGLNV